MRDIYGLIGFPLGHSFSQDFFNKKFNDENINAVYKNFELSSIKDFSNIINNYPELQGLNVTIPYKSEIIPYLDELDYEARRIGAVNVIKFIRTDGDLKLIGYNSDITGFRQSIYPLIKEFQRKALVLGTGGASKAVNAGLKKLGIEVKSVSRNKINPETITYSEIDETIMKEHLIIVNTTPVGMYPYIDECPDIPYELLTPNHLCYDLIYNPKETLFMKKSAFFGANVKNGLEMLILQALAAWDIWTT